jgi:hypothetical protein
MNSSKIVSADLIEFRSASSEIGWIMAVAWFPRQPPSGGSPLTQRPLLALRDVCGPTSSRPQLGYKQTYGDIGKPTLMTQLRHARPVQPTSAG